MKITDTDAARHYRAAHYYLEDAESLLVIIKLERRKHKKTAEYTDRLCEVIRYAVTKMRLAGLNP